MDGHNIVQVELRTLRQLKLDAYRHVQEGNVVLSLETLDRIEEQIDVIAMNLLTKGDSNGKTESID